MIIYKLIGIQTHSLSNLERERERERKERRERKKRVDEKSRLKIFCPVRLNVLLI